MVRGESCALGGTSPVLGATMPAARGNGSTHSEGDWARLEAERQRLSESLALAERERQLLGYEIHDSVIQDLTAAVMRLEEAGRQATFALPASQESYATGLRLLRESIANARQMIDSLTPQARSEADLSMSLRRLALKFRTDLALPVTFECQANDLRLPPPTQHLLLRIAQEGLFNAWKHAQAGQVVLGLAKNRDELTLSIVDDGIGFDPSQMLAGHFGLEGIRARARILGALLNITSSPGRGTNIEVQLALPPGAHHA